MNLFELAIVVSAVDQASGPLNSVGGSMAGLLAGGAAMQGYAQQVSAVGDAMAQTGTVILGTFVGALMTVDEAGDKVEDSLAKVVSVVTPLSGTIEDASARMKNAALDWSSAHTQTATQFLDTTYMMISAGLDERAAVEATRSAMLVATATMGDGASAAGLLATIYNNMGDKTRDASVELAHLGDVVTKTQQTFQFANLDQLNEGLKFGIPTALQYGIGIEELSTIIGQFNNAGLQGSMAGTAFGASMNAMQKASQDLGFSIARTSSGGVDFIGTVKNIEQQFGSLKDFTPEVQAAFQQAFGGEGWRGLSLMIGKSAELEANLGKVRDNAGAAANAAQVIESAGSALDQILLNNVEAFKVHLSDELAPGFSALQESIGAAGSSLLGWLKANPGVVQSVTNAVNGLMISVANFLPHVLRVVQAVGNWMQAHPTLVGWLVKAAAALGVLLVVVGSALSFIVPIIGVVGTVIMAGLAAPLAIAAGVVWLLLKAWDLLKGAATAVWGAIVAAVAGPWTALWASVTSTVTGAWASIVGALSGMWSAVSGAISGAWSALSGLLSSMWSEVVAGFKQNFFLGIFAVLKNFTPAGWIVRGFAALTAAIPGAIASVAAAVPGAWAVVTSTVSSAAQATLAAVGAAFLAIATWPSTAWSIISTVVPAAWAAIEGGVSSAAQATLAAVGAAFLAIATWPSTAWNTIVAAAPAAWATIQAVVKGGIDALMAVFAYFSPVPVFQQAWAALTEWLSSLSLVESGTALLQTLAQGIQAAAGLPVEALQAVVQRLRNMLPFSPAKDGPLRDLDKIRLVETIAQTLRPAPLVAAMATVATAATAAMPAAAAGAYQPEVQTMPAGYNPAGLANVGVPAGFAPSLAVPTVPSVLSVPRVAPLATPNEGRETTQGPATGPLGLPPISITFQIQGDATPQTVDQLERWVRENEHVLYQVVQSAARRDERGRF